MSGRTDNPYPGPNPFGTEHLFCGREEEARRLRVLVISEKVVLFFAPSGAGKSSLINAALIPSLRKKRYHVFPVARVSTEPEPPTEVNAFAYSLLHNLGVGETDALACSRLRKADISDTEEDDADRPSLAQVLADLASNPVRESRSESSIQPRILIIDQFEEILTAYTHRWQERDGFFELLGKALECDASLGVVLAIRVDYVGFLDRYAHWLPDRLQARFYMEPLTPEEALKAIKQPAGQAFGRGVAESLVAHLRKTRVLGTDDEYYDGPYVQPVQLQVVCFQLWDSIAADQEPQITQDMLTDLAGGEDLTPFVNDALAQFYEREVKRVTREAPVQLEFQVRQWFERKLITRDKTRDRVVQGESETAGLDSAVVKALEDRYLLRAEVRTATTRYELVHDRFIEPILEANTRWRQAHPLIQAAVEWDDADRIADKLLTGPQLQEAQQHSDAKVELVREYLDAGLAFQEAYTKGIRDEERKKRHNLRLAIAALVTGLVVIVALVTWAVRNGIIAQNSQEVAATAQTASAIAQATSTKANKDLSEAQTEIASAHTFVAQAAATSTRAAIVATSAAVSVTIAEATVTQAAINVTEAELDLATAQAELTQTEDLIRVRNARLLADLAGQAMGRGTQASVLFARASVSQTLDQDSTSVPEARNALQNAVLSSRIRRTLDGNSGPIRDVAISQDGTVVVTAGSDGMIRIWKTACGEQTTLLPAHEGEIRAVAVGPDGDRVATGGIDGTVWVWASGEWKNLKLPEAAGSVACVAFSHDSHRLAACEPEGKITVWDLQQEKEANSLTIEADPDGIVFLDDNRLLVSTGTWIQVWDIQSPKSVNARIDTPWKKGDLIPGFALDSDGTYLAAARSDKGVGVWGRLDSSEEWQQLLDVELRTEITDLALSADGDHLVTANNDGKVQVWDVSFSDVYAQLWGHSKPIMDIAFTADGRSLATASQDGSISVWDAATYTRTSILEPGREVTITHLAFVTQTRRLRAVVVGATTTISEWNVSDLEPHGTASSLTPALTATISIALSQDGAHLAVVRKDGRASVWDFLADEPRLRSSVDQTAGEKPERYASAAINGDGTRLALVDSSGKVTIRGPDPGQDLVCGAGEPVTAIALDLKGEQLARAGESGEVIVYAVSIGQEGREGTCEELWRTTPGGQVGSLAFDPHHARLAIADWNMATQQATIQVWDLVTQDQKPVLLTGRHEVRGLEFDPLQDRLAASRADGVVRLYTLDVQHLFDVACQHTDRNLTQEEWTQSHLGVGPADWPIADPQICQNLPLHPSIIWNWVGEDIHLALEKVQTAVERVQQPGCFPKVTAKVALAQALVRSALEQDPETDPETVLRTLDKWEELDYPEGLFESVGPDQLTDLVGVYGDLCWSADQARPEVCQLAFTRAPEIKVGQPITGALRAGQSEYWSFEGQKGQILTITMDGVDEGFDPVLSLRSLHGEKIAENDDSSEGLGAKIVDWSVPDDGTFVIRAQEYNRLAGAYALSLRELPQSQLEPGEPFVGNTGDDTKWVFDGTEQQIVRIELRTEGAVHSLLFLSLPDGVRHTLRGDGDDDPSSLILNMSLPQTGQYVLSVQHSEKTQSTYTITRTEITQTLPLTYTDGLTGSVVSGSGDIWLFSPEVYGAAQATMSSTRFLPSLAVYSSEGALLKRDVGLDADDTASVAFTHVPGTYILIAGGAIVTDTGPYTLSLTRLETPTIPQVCGLEDDPADYGPIDIGSRVELGRHRAWNGEENWNDTMEQYVGRRAVVTELMGTDRSGCPIVRVDVDDGRWLWRIRDMTLTLVE